MLFFMIYSSLWLFGVDPLDYVDGTKKSPQINENPHFSKIAPMVANCKFDRSNPDNVKYSCK